MGIWDTTPFKEVAVAIDDHTKEIVENIDMNAKREFVKTESVKEEFKGLPVRGNGDRIYLLKGGKKMWITNKEVYEKLGFKFGDEEVLDFETLQVIPDGEPLR